MMQRSLCCLSFLVLVVVTFACGCDQPVAKKKPTAPALIPAPPPVVAQPVPVPEVPTETVKAEVGVGQKGRSLDEHEGMVVTPVKSLFAFQERAVFEIQLPSLLQLYKAEHGEGPKSHEEFMEKIVNMNQIKLPELPPRNEYRYNVATEELEVVRPVKQ